MKRIHANRTTAQACKHDASIRGRVQKRLHEIIACRTPSPKQIASRPMHTRSIARMSSALGCSMRTNKALCRVSRPACGLRSIAGPSESVCRPAMHAIALSWRTQRAPALHLGGRRRQRRFKLCGKQATFHPDVHARARPAAPAFVAPPLHSAVGWGWSPPQFAPPI